MLSIYHTKIRFTTDFSTLNFIFIRLSFQLHTNHTNYTQTTHFGILPLKKSILNNSPKRPFKCQFLCTKPNTFNMCPHILSFLHNSVQKPAFSPQSLSQKKFMVFYVHFMCFCPKIRLFVKFLTLKNKDRQRQTCKSPSSVFYTLYHINISIRPLQLPAETRTLHRCPLRFPAQRLHCVLSGYPLLWKAPALCRRLRGHNLSTG